MDSGLFVFQLTKGKKMTHFAKPTLYTTSEAADFLDVTISALEAWRLQGRGPVYRKIGRLVRNVESDLLAYLDNCSRQSTSQMPVHQNTLPHHALRS